MRLALYIIAASLSCAAAPAFPEIIATRNIFKGEVLTPRDIDVSDAENRNRVASLIGHEAVRLIYKGSVITASDVGPIRLVNRNDIVTVNLQFGALQISMRGRSLDAGGKNETIRVMNLDSRKIIQAKVKSAQIVEVEHED